jgi:hypothetical protein
MSKNTRQKAIQQEDRLVLAINTLKKCQITKIRQAARLYNVPLATLYGRLHGRTEQASTCANNLQLSKTKKESLKKWIILLASHGAAPRPSAIQAMADILLSKHGDPTPQRNVGVN